MNWIERLYEIKGRDLYSQNGEGIILEYIFYCFKGVSITNSIMFDLGGGDGFYLSNSKHLENLGMKVLIFDRENGFNITIDNCIELKAYPTIISIDIDGNDYWILQKQLQFYKPAFVVAEFNPAFGDSRTIKYNADHIWDGTDYYGFSFHAGVKLAEANGYKVIFQIADMNMIMVREDLIKVPIPPVTFKLNNFFKSSERPESDWVFV